MDAPKNGGHTPLITIFQHLQSTHVFDSVFEQYSTWQPVTWTFVVITLKFGLLIPLT